MYMSVVFLVERDCSLCEVGSEYEGTDDLKKTERDLVLS